MLTFSTLLLYYLLNSLSLSLSLSLSPALSRSLSLVDGDRGQVFVRPGDDIRQSFLDTKRIHEERREHYNALVPLASETTDAEHISLLINAGLLVDVEQYKIKTNIKHLKQHRVGTHN